MINIISSILLREGEYKMKIIVYLIGCVVAFVSMISDHDDVKPYDIGLAIVCSLSSWMYIVVLLFCNILGLNIR